MSGFDNLVFRIGNKETDSRKLGRWSIITIAGKNLFKTAIITFSSPARGNLTGSEYSWHLVYLSNKRDGIPEYIVCPL